MFLNTIRFTDQFPQPKVEKKNIALLVKSLPWKISMGSESGITFWTSIYALGWHFKLRFSKHYSPSSKGDYKGFQGQLETKKKDKMVQRKNHVEKKKQWHDNHDRHKKSIWAQLVGEVELGQCDTKFGYVIHSWLCQL